MKARHVLIFAASAVTLAILIAVIMTTYWQRHQPVLTIDAPRLLSALREFSHNVTNKGQSWPRNVSLRELVSGGYLSADEVRAFEGMEVTIWPSALDSNPNAILMSARLADGTVNALLADGSVQQISSQRLQAQLPEFGQPDVASNRSQLVRPETNRASATGSHP